MSTMEPNELIEGDFMYLEHIPYIKEEVYISSDESDFLNYDDCNANAIYNSKNKNEIEFNDVVNDKTDHHHEDILNHKAATTNSGNLQINYLNDSAAAVEVDRAVPIDDIHNAGKTTSNEKQYNIFDKVCEASNTYQNDSKTTKKKEKIFCLKNMISLCCSKCANVRKKLLGVKQIECQRCKTLLQYRCDKCNSRYKSYISAYYHLKKTCSRNRENDTTTFYCSACYYETMSKENLDNHMRSRHAILECSDCGEKCESNLMKKHQLFECKFSITKKSVRNRDAVSNKEMKTLNKYTQNRLFLQHTSIRCYSKILLEQYCKRCDKSLENGKRRGLKKCKICKARLVYQCATCCKRYKLLISAYTHVRICNNPFQYQCLECDFRTPYKISLTSHVERKHVLKECQECNAVCENYKSLKYHELYECKSNPRYKGDAERQEKKSNKKK